MAGFAGRGALFRWLVGWAALFTLFYTVHLLLWLHNGFVVSMEPLGWLLKPIGNLVHVLTFPGWLTARLLLRSWGESDLLASFVACAVGALVLVLVLVWLSEVRRVLGGFPTPQQQRQRAERGILVSRRKLLADGLVLGTGMGATAALADAACFAPERLRVTRYTIPIENLPEALDGLRLAQITDTHLGPRVPRELIDEAMRLAIGLKPDVFLLTGDYVHCGLEWVTPAAGQFATLAETGKPVLGVLGNHDWFNDGRLMSRRMSEAGVCMIDNDRRFLSMGRGGVCRIATAPEASCICLAGLGDLQQHCIDPVKALASVDPSMPRLVLSHNPDSAEEAGVSLPGSPRIDLMISGHTHGGQVRIPGVGTGTGMVSRFGDKYAAGLVRGPACRVLISRGVGMSLVPFRFLVPPEVVEITLKRTEPRD